MRVSSHSKKILILGNSIRVSESVTIGNPKVDDIVSDKNLAPETDYPFSEKTESLKPLHTRKMSVLTPELSGN